MSIVNISFEAERIACLTDTLRYSADNTPIGLCAGKCVFTPTFAVTTRGLVRPGDPLKAAALEYDSLDAYAADVPAYLRGVLDYADGDPQYVVEAFAMGWSAAKGDLAVYRWFISAGKSDEVEFKELPRGLHLAPTFANLPIPAPPYMDDQRMVKVAIAQHRITRSKDLSICVGGVMHLTEVTREGAFQRIVGVYPDYDDHAGLFGDPLSEDVEAFLVPH